jgi:hypothetical protein
MELTGLGFKRHKFLLEWLIALMTQASCSARFALHFELEVTKMLPK